jgi:hypothetical protein
MTTAQAWQAVGKAWQDGHEACWSCGYCKEGRQAQPYGSGVAYEPISECLLGQRASDSPQSCPAINALDEADAAEAYQARRDERAMEGFLA